MMNAHDGRGGGIKMLKKGYQPRTFSRKRNEDGSPVCIQDVSEMSAKHFAQVQWKLGEELDENHDGVISMEELSHAARRGSDHRQLAEVAPSPAKRSVPSSQSSRRMRASARSAETVIFRLGRSW